MLSCASVELELGLIDVFPVVTEESLRPRDIG